MPLPSWLSYCFRLFMPCNFKKWIVLQWRWSSKLHLTNAIFSHTPFIDISRLFRNGYVISTRLCLHIHIELLKMIFLLNSRDLLFPSFVLRHIRSSSDNIQRCLEKSNQMSCFFPDLPQSKVLYEHVLC